MNSVLNQKNIELSARRYRVFISYRHADNQEEGRRWANWLHEMLESYEVPKRLVGKLNSQQLEIPETLFPVFRDEDELPADADLSQAIRAALINSDNLVVICSPKAVESRFVHQEIAEFKELGKSQRVFALIIAGEPNCSVGIDEDHLEECLPRSLRSGVVTTDGSIDWGIKAEPICADARPEGKMLEGYTTAGAYQAFLKSEKKHTPTQLRQLTREYGQRLELAKMKIIAGILGVPLGMLTRENDKYRIERLRKALAVIGSLATLAIIGFVVAVLYQQLAVREKRSALHANKQANILINEMLYSLGDQLKPLGQMKLLEKVSAAAKDYFVNLPNNDDNKSVAKNRAVMWINTGNVLEELNQSESAIQAFKTANDELVKLGGKSTSGPPDIRRYYSINLERLADLMEEDKVALQYVNEAVSIHESLLQNSELKSEYPSLCRELGQIYERLGDIYEDSQSNLAAALEAFQKSMFYRTKYLDADPKQAQAQRDTGVAHARLGDIYSMLGKYSDALRHYEQGLKIREQLIQQHALNTIWQSEISRSYQSLGLTYQALEQHQSAQTAFKKSHQIIEILSQFDPSQSKWKLALTRACQYLAINAQLLKDSTLSTFFINEAKRIIQGMLSGKADSKTQIEGMTVKLTESQILILQEKYTAALAILNVLQTDTERILSSGKKNDKISRIHGLTWAAKGFCFAKQNLLDQSFTSYTSATEKFKSLNKSDQNNN